MENFSITLSNGKVWNGRSFPVQDAQYNLLIMTGMCEHATRYKDFAEYLNSKNINVCVLDAMGQGLNVSSVEELQKVRPGDFEDNIQAAYDKITEMKSNGLPTFLMGHSMGSFMTQYFIELHPEYADKVVLCASNGGQAGLMGLSKVIANIHVRKGNWDKPSHFIQNLGLGGYSKAIKDRKTDNDWLSYNERNVEEYNNDPYSGVVNSNGFWREFLNGMSKIWSKKYVSKISKKERILIVAGQDDPVGQFGKGILALEKQYKKVGVAECDVIIYQKMRHEILNEDNKATVYDDIAKFLVR